MASMFEAYDDVPEPVLENEATETHFNNRKIEKRLKKNAKMMKKILKNQRKAEKSKSKGLKIPSFLKKIGDAIIKAIPRVLGNIATAVVKGLFDREKNRECYSH